MEAGGTSSGKWGSESCVAGQRKVVSKGTEAGPRDQLLALIGAGAGAGLEAGQSGGQVMAESSGLCGWAAWLPVLALPPVSSVTPESDFTSVSHTFHHCKQ